MDKETYETLEEIDTALAGEFTERDLTIIKTQIKMLLRMYRFSQPPEAGVLDKQIQSWWRKLLP